MPDAEAFEAAAPLVEWALNTDVSTPDSLSEVQIVLMIVLAVTPPWGAMTEKNKNWLMFEFFLNEAVRST